MSATITAVCTKGVSVHMSLPGWLECAMTFFDAVLIITEDDETDIVKLAMTEASTDYVAFLKPWERFYRYLPIIECSRLPSPEEVVESVKRGIMPSTELTVEARIQPYNQGDSLRTILNVQKPDMVSLMRRSWHNFAMTRLVRHWNNEPQEFQIMKREIADPNLLRQAICRPNYGPFIDDFRAAFEEMKK